MFDLVKRAFNLMFAYKSECVNGKKPWRSKQLWANAIAMVAAVLSRYAGVELSAEDSLIVLAMVNVVLRMVTKEPVGFYEEKS